MSSRAQGQLFQTHLVKHKNVALQIAQTPEETEPLFTMILGKNGHTLMVGFFCLFVLHTATRTGCNPENSGKVTVVRELGAEIWQEEHGALLLCAKSLENQSQLYYPRYFSASLRTSWDEDCCIHAPDTASCAVTSKTASPAFATAQPSLAGIGSRPWR